ncbi:MAG TPA: ABC transporter permease [Thermomicrobiales bacterium]|nr:ABC transporter permease [Thermomicrobiales bacterium]
MPAASRRRGAFAGLVRALRQSPVAVAALAVIALWIAVAFFAPLLAPYPPLKQDVMQRLAPPSAAHWFGTDPLGRDIFSRVLYGSRLSLPVGVAAVVLALVFGTLLGSVAGFLGGRIDEVIMRVTDLFLAFPTVILAMVITAALGAGVRNAIIAIMIAWWPSYARNVRGLVLATRHREFVLAATALGAARPRIFLKHVLPSTLSPLVILGTLDLGHAILTFAALSFLGLGAPPDQPEWGAMIATGRSYFDQWWIGAFPGVAILSVALAFNLVGDSLRDYFDPRYRNQ